MKKLLVFFLVVAIAFSVTSPAFAKTTKSRFNLVGTVTGVDLISQTVMVEVRTGNYAVKLYYGQSLDIETTLQTRFLKNDGITTTPITFSYLAVGQKVSVQGTVSASIWTATRITVDEKGCPK